MTPTTTETTVFRPPPPPGKRRDAGVPALTSHPTHPHSIQEDH
jgi:hypothetical protein